MNVFIKFIGVGIINTIFYYLLYSIFIFFTHNYVLAVIGANIIGILFSFKTFGKYVFKNEDNKLLFKFLLVYGWNIILNIILIKIFNVFIQNLYVSGLFATMIVALNSFFLNKIYVYQRVNQ